MNFFVDKNRRRKSPFALAAFGAALAYLCVFGVLYAFLAEPLYNAFAFSSAFLTNALHSLIIAVIGTAVCCLMFLLKDKRVCPGGFAGLLVVLCMFYAASLMLDAQSRAVMLPIISSYGIAPVVVGNAVTWLIYAKIRRGNPTQNHKKTIQEELKEAIRKEEARKGGSEAQQRPPQEAPAPEAGSAPEETPAPSPEELLDAAIYGSCAPSGRSAEEEAMLIYEEENDD